MSCGFVSTDGGAPGSLLQQSRPPAAVRAVDTGASQAPQVYTTDSLLGGTLLWCL